MIKTREDLNNCLKHEKKIYLGNSSIIDKICSENQIYIFHFQKYLRKTEFYHNNSGIINKILYVYYRQRKNILGRKLGIEIWDNTFEVGLEIYHSGNIVVNGMSKIGKNCRLHGSNCIGNDGKSLDSPIIGDNVRIGVGAKIIGGITIADNITVAAGAVVVDSFLESGVTIGGVPAHIINMQE